MTRIDDLALKVLLVSLFLVFGIEGQIDIFLESLNDLVAFRQGGPALENHVWDSPGERFQQHRDKIVFFNDRGGCPQMIGDR